MIDVGETAPEFSLPKAGGTVYNDIDEFSLSAALGDGPIVLAFFPAAFTSGCTVELCTFRDEIGRFSELNAQVYGISVDLPPAQNVFIQQEGLTFPLLSDWDHEVIHKYGVIRADMYGLFEVAQRSIFVLDAEGTVTYRWVEPEDAGEIDFEAVVESARSAVADLPSS